MPKKISKTHVKNEIEEFFSKIENKTPKEVKKIKKVAMSKNIKLGEKRKLFCKKCLTPYSGKEKVRIREGIKSVFCENCGFKARWKVN